MLPSGGSSAVQCGLCSASQTDTTALPPLAVRRAKASSMWAAVRSGEVGCRSSSQP